MQLTYETRRTSSNWCVIARQGDLAAYGFGRSEAQARADADRRLAALLKIEAIHTAARARGECPTCAQIRELERGFGPSHNGSSRCESGSIASGGTSSHCTCSACF